MRIFIRVYAYLYTRIRAHLCAFYARILVNVFLSGTVVLMELKMKSKYAKEFSNLIKMVIKILKAKK